VFPTPTGYVLTSFGSSLLNLKCFPCSRGVYLRSRPHWQSTGYYTLDQAGIEVLIMLGLNFDWAETKSAMTLVLVLSANVRRSERLK
jgi:hypothetical protein